MIVNLRMRRDMVRLKVKTTILDHETKESFHILVRSTVTFLTTTKNSYHSIIKCWLTWKPKQQKVNVKEPNRQKNPTKHTRK